MNTPTQTTPVVHYLLINDIVVPANRDRQEFKPDEIASLASSITKVGLLHLPVVRQGSTGFILVVGERRFRAMKKLHAENEVFVCMGSLVPRDRIPVLFYEELDAGKAKEVELEENLRRVDLSWQEKTKAIATLHTLLGGNTTNTVNVLKGAYNTTVETSKINTSKLLVQFMHHPEVATARTEDDAIKQMYKVAQRQIDLKLGQTAKPSCDYRFGDALVELARLPDESVDCFCFDPPYGIDADKSDIHQFQGQVHHYKDAWDDVHAMLCTLAPLVYDKAKPQAHLYSFCDITHFDDLRLLFNIAGWNVWTRPIIWMKDTGIVPALDYGPRRMYESILFANKGKKFVTGVYNDCVQFPYDASRVHAAQKPTALIKNLLIRSTRPGDVVCDPFCGSGTIFIAGNELKLTTIGIDNDPAMAAIIAKRIQDGK